jgi:hypothetical protein
MAQDNDRFLDMMERYFDNPSEFKWLQERPQLHYQVAPQFFSFFFRRRFLISSSSSDRLRCWCIEQEFSLINLKGNGGQLWEFVKRTCSVKDLNSFVWRLFRMTLTSVNCGHNSRKDYIIVPSVYLSVHVYETLSEENDLHESLNCCNCIYQWTRFGPFLVDSMFIWKKKKKEKEIQ